MTLRKLLASISLLILTSLIFSACGQGSNSNNDKATATAPATQTVIVAPTFTPTVNPTSTLEPNPGVDELKKIDPKILDGGPIEFFGRTFDETAHDPQGATFYTDSYHELVFIKKEGLLTAWTGEDHLAFTPDKNSKYLRYRWNQAEKKIDIALAMKQLLYAINQDADAMLQVAPMGIAFRYSIQGMNGMPEIGDDITVKVDHVHDVRMPTPTWQDATNYSDVKKGTTKSFVGGMIIGFTCDGDTIHTVVIAFGTYTSQCDEKDRTAMNVYFLTKDNKPREGTAEENARLRKNLLSQLDYLSRGYDTYEYFWDGAEIGDVYPLSSFSAMHAVAPTATSTIPATSTNTPRPVTPYVSKTPTATPKP